jgi:hypothetical protein
MKLFKCNFITDIYDPEFSPHEEFFIAENEEQIALQFPEFFEDEFRVKMHGRRIQIIEIKNIEGVDGNGYDIVPVVQNNYLENKNGGL